MTATTEVKLLTLTEVAEQTGLSIWWLRNRCRDRELEYVKVGKWFKMNPGQIEAAVSLATVPRTIDTQVARENARRTQRPARPRSAR